MRKVLAYVLVGTLLTGVSVSLADGSRVKPEYVPVAREMVEHSPTQEPTLLPEEAPVVTPAETPTEEPTETPTEEPTETPTEAPTETPTEAPTETHTEAPTETPTETPAETPTEAPTETPAATPTETPEVTPTETPEVTPTETPEVSPTETPADVPTETPGAESSDAPVPTPEVGPEQSVPGAVRIRVEMEGSEPLYYGDMVTLRAVVEADDAAVEEFIVQWQYYDAELARSDPEADPWVSCSAEGTEYSFVLTQESAARRYRAIAGEVASEEFVLGEVRIRPEAEEPPHTVEELKALLDADRGVKFTATYDGEQLHFGDDCTLTAQLHGYDRAAYTLQWQTSADNADWTDVEGATGTECVINVTQDNYDDYWRVVITVTGPAEGSVAE